MKQRTLFIVLTAINAALYTVVGALTYGGFTFYGVRFWPAVIVPATFAALFGPGVGGIGAAIGILLADVIFGHGNALLSLIIGVPSNFLGFAIIGKFSRIKNESTEKWLPRFLLVGTIGLGIGSLYIGYGLVFYSYGFLFNEIFALPLGFEQEMSLIAAQSISLWTFVSEIPFVFMAVIVMKPIKTAFPGLISEIEDKPLEDETLLKSEKPF